MIKRLMFDIDNTLIPWDDKYDKQVDEVLKEIQYPRDENLYIEINNAETEYEKNTKYFDKNEMLDYINNKLNLKLPLKFIDLWLEKLKYCVPEKLKDEDYKVLEYLQSKYELVAVTNWFKEVQVERMKNVGIYKFFKEVYGAEKYAKPYKQSFLQAVGEYKLEECAMIGDNLETDIKGAKNAGIKTLVWVDNQGKKDKHFEELENVYVVENLGQLKEIF